MKYRSLTFPQLSKTLRERKLGNPILYNELNKIYGVTYIPQKQAAAREEAIKILEEADKGKVSLSKLAKAGVAIIGLTASIVAIVEFVRG